MKNYTMTPARARKCALYCQLLDGRIKLPPGKEGIAQTIEKLGYVQIDTISVVNRAHHHTLWTRRPDYTKEHLHDLQAQDRRIFEYWGHGASYLPIQDYRYYIPLMHAHRKPKSTWIQAQLKNCRHIMKDVYKRIETEGPLCSKDFNPPSGRKRGTWWDWKPAKTALELLFWQGELMITERQGFQRVYDLTERVLPSRINTSIPGSDELGRFLLNRALSAMGIAQLNEICSYIYIAGKETIENALSEGIHNGTVVPVTLKEGNDSQYYSLTDTLEQSAKLRTRQSNIHILSPFDNLVINRNRTKQLFNFDYSLECYLPARQRKYGYFCLPVLWGDTFIARLDAKADRKNNVFILKNLVFESACNKYEKLIPLLAQSIQKCAAFNQCTTIKTENVSPAKIRSPLKKEIAQV